MITKKDYEVDLKQFRAFIRKNPLVLDNYVYALVDPRRGREQVFYVGKGQTDRMFKHILESFSVNQNNTPNYIGKKLERIQMIHNAGEKVKMYILHYGLTSEHALIVESVLIDVFQNFKEIDTQAIGDLTNSIHGFDSRRGFCDVKSLYKNSEVTEKVKILPGEKVLLIKIAGTESEDNEILERVRKHWRINPDRADKADYIAACRNGVIIGLYKNKSKWQPSLATEDHNNEGRYYFEGIPVEDPTIRERYIGRFVDIPHGARYPVMYLGGWK